MQSARWTAFAASTLCGGRNDRLDDTRAAAIKQYYSPRRVLHYSSWPLINPTLSRGRFMFLTHGSIRQRRSLGIENGKDKARGRAHTHATNYADLHDSGELSVTDIRRKQTATDDVVVKHCCARAVAVSVVHRLCTYVCGDHTVLGDLQSPENNRICK